jgi:hypothetical protein
MQDQFVKTIGNHRFGFTRVAEPALGYQVDFLHKEELRVFKMMLSSNAEWEIDTANMPSFIYDLLDELKNAIVENESKK